MKTIKEAKEQMKELRIEIKDLKEKRIHLSCLISRKEEMIRNIKGAIYRGEING